MIITRCFPRKLLLMVALRMGLLSGAWAALVYAGYVHADLTFLLAPFLHPATQMLVRQTCSVSSS